MTFIDETHTALPIEVVRSFFAAWSTKDAELIISHLSDDVIWHDIAQLLPPRHGRDDFLRRFHNFAPLFGECELRILNIAATETGVVLCERLDRFHIKGRWYETPANSAIQVRDGKIVEVREYLDLDRTEREIGELLGEAVELSASGGLSSETPPEERA